MLEKQIVIMGAGLAGLSAAVSAREKGAEVLVLEQKMCGRYFCDRNGTVCRRESPSESAKSG